MSSFNLLTEPWITCMYPTGSVEEFSLSGTLLHAHEVAEITDESPLVVAALHRLLLAILHRVFGPADAGEWGKLWRESRFPRNPLEQYFDKWKDRFDLLHESHPFYQTSEITLRLGNSWVSDDSRGAAGSDIWPVKPPPFQ